MTTLRGVAAGICTVAMAGGAAGACRSSAIPQAARWPAGTAFRTVEQSVAGTRLRMIDTGSGPAVVFVHGLGGSIYTWRGVLGPVVQAGYRVVAFDNRGFGGSSRPDTGYTNASYARLLVALLDSLRIEQAVLVGHSMGGEIVAEVAIGHGDRVRGLVMIGAAGYGVREPWTLRLARWPIIGRIATALRGRWTTAGLLRSTYAEPSRVTEADIDQYHWSVAAPGTARAFRGVLRSFRFDALPGRLSRLAPPTLLVWGARDRWIPLELAQRMAFELPNGALFVVPDAGHNVQDEKPGEVARVLLDFLRDGLPRPPADVAVSKPLDLQPDG